MMLVLVGILVILKEYLNLIGHLRIDIYAEQRSNYSHNSKCQRRKCNQPVFSQHDHYVFEVAVLTLIHDGLPLVKLCRPLSQPLLDTPLQELQFRLLS